MEIVHLAPFAPNGAGIYEAARDMVRADTEYGHSVTFVDVGMTLKNGTQQPPQVGAVDDRGGFLLATQPPEWINHADVLVYHTGVHDGWVVKCQAPIVLVVHGRPLASYRPEQLGMTQNAYSLLAHLAQWPRIKKLVYFWPEHTPYWQNIVPEEKLAPLDWPPIDLERFKPEGEVYQIPDVARGKYNALICDSWREDIDIFEITNGAIEAARRIPGLKVHFYAVETQEGTTNVLPCFEPLIAALRQLGALGEIWGRRGDFEQVYRAMDFVMTPHRIVTRVIGEALACGTPVVAVNGNKVAPWFADTFIPDDVATAVVALISALDNERDLIRRDCRDVAELHFALPRYAKAMDAIYQAAVAR